MWPSLKNQILNSPFKLKSLPISGLKSGIFKMYRSLWSLFSMINVFGEVDLECLNFVDPIVVVDLF